MMWRKLFATDNDAAALVLRVVLGIVFFAHGAQKALGWFGGFGFTGTMNHFTENMGIPYILALLVIAAEFLGAFGLIAGFLTRIAAFGIAAVMVGAIFMVHIPFGFFMDWSGTGQGQGFEFHLLAIAMAVALMIRGGGLWSVDRAITPDR
jgi:putative oxidoreductase